LLTCRSICELPEDACGETPYFEIFHENLHGLRFSRKVKEQEMKTTQMAPEQMEMDVPLGMRMGHRVLHSQRPLQLPSTTNNNNAKSSDQSG
jgi:hypothetical protein